MQMTFKRWGAGLHTPHTPPTLCIDGQLPLQSIAADPAGHGGRRTRANSHKSQGRPREGPQEPTLAGHKHTRLNAAATPVKQPMPRACGERMLPACDTQLIH